MQQATITTKTIATPWQQFLVCRSTTSRLIPLCACSPSSSPLWLSPFPSCVKAVVARKKKWLFKKTKCAQKTCNKQNNYLIVSTLLVVFLCSFELLRSILMFDVGIRDYWHPGNTSSRKKPNTQRSKHRSS